MTIEITNAELIHYHKTLQAVERARVLCHYKLRYASDRLEERMSRARRTYDKMHEELIAEHAQRDEEGRRLAEVQVQKEDPETGRAQTEAVTLHEGRGPQGQVQMLREAEEGNLQPYQLAPGQRMRYLMEDRAAFQEAYLKLSQEKVEVELHLVEEDVLEKEGPIDSEALMRLEREMQRNVMRPIRQLLIRGNQEVFARPGEEEEAEPAAA